MLSGVAEFVIQGLTVDGRQFRQEGDWAQNLCNMMATTGPDGRVVYSAYLRPVVIDGIPAVVVQALLQEKDARVFEVIRQFVAENRLMVRSGRGSRDTEATGPHPVIGVERRKPGSGGW